MTHFTKVPGAKWTTSVRIGATCIALVEGRPLTESEVVSLLMYLGLSPDCSKIRDEFFPTCGNQALCPTRELLERIVGETTTG